MCALFFYEKVGEEGSTEMVNSEAKVYSQKVRAGEWVIQVVGTSKVHQVVDAPTAVQVAVVRVALEITKQ